MKNRIKLLSIALILSLGFTACVKEAPIHPYRAQPINNVISQGIWKVASFNINGIEVKDHYTQYDFKFNAGGLLTATSLGGRTDGKWFSGFLRDHIRLYIDLGTQDPLFLMNNEDWQVMKQDSKNIFLKGNRGDDGSETLTFQKQ